MESNNNSISVIKLEGANWNIGKLQTTVLLRGNGYLEIVEDKKVKPEVISEIPSWEAKDAKAQMFLVTQMSEEVIFDNNIGLELYAMRNYCGILVSSNQYKNFGYHIENKLTFHSQKRDPDTIERLWFLCGYDDSIYLVVSTNSDDEDRLIKAGMLLDIRELGELPQANSFFDMAIHRLTSRSERIRICNQIRVIFSSRSRICWCGAEYESIFDRNVVQNAPEINGLAELGRSMSIRGVWSGAYPQPKSRDRTSDVIAQCLTFSDPGQRKLGALFHSIAIPHSTIVYVGSAPGSAWLRALPYYRNVNKVISIDPRPLEGEVPSNVVHHRLAIASPDVLLSLMQGENNCVLVWDVRGDANTSAERDLMVLAEIALLNSILQETSILKRCFLLHIKINMKHCVSYYLPEKGRFLVQPYTLTRDVYEARYVVHLRENAPLVFSSLTIAVRDLLKEEISHVLVSLRNGELIEAELVCNMLCSRYRRVDYLFERSYNDTVEEIFLFTINHNPGPRVLDHLRALRDMKRRYIVSFFTGSALGNDPYPFPEREVLLNELGTILDSRSLVPAKVEGLYFLFSEQMNDLFREEAFTSETYRIRKTEYSVVSRSRIPVYDGVRTEACAAVGAVFPKFPNDFSIADALISPSGHALRMVLECISGKASLAMFAEIICSFRSVSRSYVKRSFAQKQVKIESSSFVNSLRHSGSEKSSLERSTKGI